MVMNRRVNGRQKARLIEIMEEHYMFLYGANRELSACHSRDEKWEKIAEELNGIGMGAVKNGKEWRQCFSAMRLGVQAKLCSIRMHMQNTGGSAPTALRMTDMDEQIRRICSPENFDGPTLFDCEPPPAAMSPSAATPPQAAATPPPPAATPPPPASKRPSPAAKPPPAAAKPPPAAAMPAPPASTPPPPATKPPPSAATPTAPAATRQLALRNDQETVTKWEEIAEELNGIGMGAAKNGKEWRQCFSSMQLAVQSKLRSIRMHMPPAAATPPPPPATPPPPAETPTPPAATPPPPPPPATPPQTASTPPPQAAATPPPAAATTPPPAATRRQVLRNRQESVDILMKQSVTYAHAQLEETRKIYKVLEQIKRRMDAQDRRIQEQNDLLKSALEQNALLLNGWLKERKINEMPAASAEPQLSIENDDVNLLELSDGGDDVNLLVPLRAQPIIRGKRKSSADAGRSKPLHIQQRTDIRFSQAEVVLVGPDGATTAAVYTSAQSDPLRVELKVEDGFDDDGDWSIDDDVLKRKRCDNDVEEYEDNCIIKSEQIE